ncbi:MAG TPA: dTDP-4-dehydrorhamnose reductase [Lentisphaeria bacterium]|nr:MAG: dTDP-4-dehydrorhamnose reductase [Lentisphaerae bacterium GWF2_38_69]HBM17036.1 dTDP-4-dehydrorhamnose reductase [Lentisphaeria bacterium]
MIRLGITGIKGMLGSDLKSLAIKNGFDVIGYDLPDYDLANDETIKYIINSCDIIVNCAAYTAVDKAESEIERTYRINAECVEKIGLAANTSKKYMVHISTDFVFGDNSTAALKEEDIPAPLGVYGASKLEGEKKLQRACNNCSIIRVQWTYGINGDNFIKKILKAAENNKTLKIVTDQIGSPTPTTSVSKAILSMIRKRATGIFHYSSEGYASRFEVAEFVLREKGIIRDLIPCESSEFITPAKRPLNSRFNCSKIDTLLDYKRGFWQDEVKEFLKLF